MKILKRNMEAKMIKEVIFHFNKKSLDDSSIPSWTLKFKGETYYVKHVESNAVWSTKETPNNQHTKGSIKFKNVNVEIRDECAYITQQNL